MENMILVLLIFVHNWICLLTLSDYDFDLFRKYIRFDQHIEVKGGDFDIGINDRQNNRNGEHPIKFARIPSFRIMQYPVTNVMFRMYMQEKSRYMSSAEKKKFSLVFSKLVDDNGKVLEKEEFTDFDKSLIDSESYMVPVIDARWNRPEGGMSSVSEIRWDHPVVHVSYDDAFAFCTWNGMRLPNEMEWEVAARASQKRVQYPWGERWMRNHSNTWQGNFPDENQKLDGHYGVASVEYYGEQNSFGMFDMIGNVWEWTSSQYYADWKGQRTDGMTRRVLKGTSFLNCRDGHEYDGVYTRISSRIGRMESYTAQNVGFRCAQTMEEKYEHATPSFRRELRKPIDHTKINRREL
ncbi:hypothetical protein SNEBB_009753 [Seison nebaliae]|nr:hypothetical protein SNEBB_009753 [Seison nebaliae]